MYINGTKIFTMVLVLPHWKLRLLLVVIISEEHEEQKRVVYLHAMWASL